MGNDIFTRNILKRIIAQFAKQVGFTSLSLPALEIFVDAILQRISTIVSETSKITAHCNRTDSNALDLFYSLDSINENPTTLSAFLSTHSFSPFPIYIKQYPIPTLSYFYRQQNNSSETNKFRAYLVFDYADSSQSYSSSTILYIPPFYPSYPDEHTYDNKITINEPKESQEENQRMEGKIKRNILGLLKSSKSDVENKDIVLKEELVDFTDTRILSQPTGLIDAPGYSLDGSRSGINPEFLKQITIKDQNLLEDSISRDTQIHLRILNIKHNYSEPGNLKDSTYVSPLEQNLQEHDNQQIPSL